MTEEVKRINKVQQMQMRKKDQMSTNLSGEQIFIRSCNMCHPGAKAGMGPSLEKLDEHFPQDAQLKALIRQGAGVMPAQPESAISDKELDSLIFYLRSLSAKEEETAG